MNIDLIALIKDALVHAGCGDMPTQDLNPHAAIELEFLSIPKITIEKSEDEAVVLHSCLSDHADRLRTCTTSRLVDTVARKAPWARHHTISLLEDDGELYLTAVVGEHCLRDGAGFSRALDGFYERVHMLCEMARG